jgi:hypothetical protein
VDLEGIPDRAFDALPEDIRADFDNLGRLADLVQQEEDAALTGRDAALSADSAELHAWVRDHAAGDVLPDGIGTRHEREWQQRSEQHKSAALVARSQYNDAAYATRRKLARILPSLDAGFRQEWETHDASAEEYERKAREERAIANRAESAFLWLCVAAEVDVDKLKPQNGARNPVVDLFPPELVNGIDPAALAAMRGERPGSGNAPGFAS